MFGIHIGNGDFQFVIQRINVTIGGMRSFKPVKRAPRKSTQTDPPVWWGKNQSIRPLLERE
jgi:hypothetical protein